jgi:DNA invertase Pin-like site-specific DNA recombinase
MTVSVVGYARVSTDEQALSGVSLDAQQAAIRAYCAMRNLEATEIVVDAGVSAGKPLASREGGRRVLDLVRSGTVVAVVAYKLDRVFRDCADCLGVVREWDHRGVALHLVDLGGQTIDTGTAMGRFFLTVMAGAAELERNLVGERTKAALAHLRATGVRLGRDALGWERTDASDAHGRLVVADLVDETDTVQQIVALSAEGMPLRAIAARLEAEGRRTKRGGRWYASTVQAVLRRVRDRDLGRTSEAA